MKIHATIIAQYPIQRGTYMGEPYQNKSVVIASTEKRPDTNLRDRLVIKFKGKYLDDFIASGLTEGSTATFDLIMDAEERNRNGEAFPINKAFVCVGVE